MRSFRTTLVLISLLALLTLSACGEPADLSGIEASLEAAEARDAKLSAKILSLKKNEDPKTAQRLGEITRRITTLEETLPENIKSVYTKLEALEASLKKADQEEAKEENTEAKELRTDIRNLHALILEIQRNAERTRENQRHYEPAPVERVAIKETFSSDPKTVSLSKNRLASIKLNYTLDILLAEGTTRQAFLESLHKNAMTSLAYKLNSIENDQILDQVGSISGLIQAGLTRSLSWDHQLNGVIFSFYIKELYDADKKLIIKDGDFSKAYRDYLAAEKKAKEKAEADAAAEEQRRQDSYGIQERLKLPGKAERIVVIDQGKLAVIKLEKQASIAVVDLKAMKLLGTVDAFSANQTFAAGGTSIVMVSDDGGVIRLFNARTMKIIDTIANPVEGVVQFMAMGADNDQRVFMRTATSSSHVSRARYEMLDLKSYELTPIECKLRNQTFGNKEEIRLSPDGTIFTARCLSHGPNGQIIGRISPTGKLELSYEHESVGKLFPLGNGGMVLTGKGGVVNLDGKAIKQHDRFQGCVAEYQGAFYVHTNMNPRMPAPPRRGRNRRLIKENSEGNYPVFDTHSHTKIADLKVLFPEEGIASMWAMPILTNKRFYMLGRDHDTILAYNFDPISQLKAKGGDYLVVTNAPTVTPSGRTYQFTPEYHTNKDKIELTMIKGPEGAKIINGKTFQWQAPTELKNPVDIILHLKSADGKVEEFFNFKLSHLE